MSNDKEPITPLTLAIIITSGSMFAATFACIIYSIYYVLTREMTPEAIRESEALLPWVLTNFSKPIIFLISSLLTGMFGYLLIRLGKASLTHTIPPEDRALLNPLITDEKTEAINLYLRLSSLRGFSGAFQHLGITGLPLATIGLTLIFAALAIWMVDNKGEPNTPFLDLAKLTLGAFIGSFVQRHVSGGEEPLKAKALAGEDLLKAKAQAEEALLKAKAQAGEEPPKAKAQAGEDLLKAKAQAGEEPPKAKAQAGEEPPKAQAQAGEEPPKAQAEGKPPKPKTVT